MTPQQQPFEGYGSTIGVGASRADFRACTLAFNKPVLIFRSSDNDKLILLAFFWTQHAHWAPQSRYPCHRPRVARFLLLLCSFF